MLVCGICRVVPLVPGARTVLVVVSGVDAADRVAAVTLIRTGFRDPELKWLAAGQWLSCPHVHGWSGVGV